EPDPYLQVLTQLSASHRPSLDNLPLSRFPATGTTSPANNPPSQRNPPMRDAAATTGRKYYSLLSERVYVELADHDHKHPHHAHAGHSTLNKVRPAAGIMPFTPGNVAGQAEVSGAVARGETARLRPPQPEQQQQEGEDGEDGDGDGEEEGEGDGHGFAQIGVPDGREGREERRRRWFRWHVAGGRPHVHDDAFGGSPGADQEWLDRAPTS
ncbi:hypothetical protein C8A05DRAFT_17277, partial [Staphylotrichum tortipilum]